MDHIHQNQKKNQKKKIKKQTKGLPNRRPNRKNRNTECDFISRIHNENFVKLQRKTEEKIRYKSDPEGNVINLTVFSFSKSESKTLIKNLNFMPTPKVYNYSELDNDLNNFFTLVKAHFKDSIKILTMKIECLKQIKTKAGHQTKIIIPLTD